MLVCSLVLLTVSFRFQTETVVFQFFMVENRSRAERGLIQFPIQFIFILFFSLFFYLQNRQIKKICEK